MCIGTLVLICTWQFNCSLFDSNRQTLAPETRTVVIGDSYPMMGINPSHLGNAENICRASEPLVVTFYKMKYLLEDSDIDTVVLGFSEHNVAKYEDLAYVGDNAGKMLRRYYPFMGPDELSALEVSSWPYYSHMFTSTVLPNKNYMGAYFSGGTPKYAYSHFFDNHTETHLTEKNFDIITERHYGTQGIANVNGNYFDSIVVYCAAQNFHLVAIDCPVHQRYRDSIPSDVEDYYKSIVAKHKDLDHVSFLDNAGVDYNDTLFRDYTHLNADGAWKFTKSIREQMITRRGNPN